MSDEKPPAWAEAMEHRIIQEVSRHVSKLQGEVRDLRSEQDVLRRMVAGLPGTMLDALQDPAVDHLTNEGS